MQHINEKRGKRAPQAARRNALGDVWADGCAFGGKKFEFGHENGKNLPFFKAEIVKVITNFY